MKNLLLLWLLLSSLSLSAQTLRTTNVTTNGTTRTDSLWFTHQEYLNYAFGNLHMAEVSTNFLLQRSLSYFDPLSYDGKNSNDITISSANHGILIHSSLYYSALDTASSYAPMHPDLLSEELNTRWLQKAVPIGLINHAYHAMKLNALQTGLFTTNIDSTILYDNLSRSVSPYERHRLFVATAFARSDVSSNGDVIFDILPTVLHFTDTLSGALEIDFGDGLGYVSVTENSQKMVYYNASGIKTIMVKQGGLISTTQINFIKDDIFYNFPEPPIEQLRSQTNNLFTTSTVITPEPILGCDGQLDKPILIVEGFNIFGDSEPRQILNKFNTGEFYQNLRNLGYDFIVIKFTNNSASIIENAAALKDYIIQLNAEKVGNEKLNIIGLSMGGLIAKYCLKDMEDSSIDHNVENYFSYDSPHQGVYIPIGMQFLLKDGSKAMKKMKDNEMVKTALKKLETQAAKEMLQFNAFDIDRSVRSSFASTYQSKGYPAQSNNYAIANGRGDGVGLGYTGSSALMELSGTLGGSLWLYHEQDLFTLNSNSSKVSYLQNSGLVALLGFKGMKSYSSKVSTSSPQPLETVPGSIDGSFKKYGDDLKSNLEDNGFDVTQNYNGREVTTYVSTASALDLNNQNYGVSGNYIPDNPYYDVHGNNAILVPNNITPFDDVIYASSTSQYHIQMDQNIANFMFEKIYGSTMPSSPCSTICSFTPNFNGINIPCDITGTTTVTIPNMPSGVVINWHVPSGISLLSGQGTNKITISNAGLGLYTGGYVTVTWPGCTSANYSFDIDHRVPSEMSIVTTLSNSACGEGVATINPTGGTYVWTVSGNLQINGSGTTLTTTSNSINITGTSGTINVTGGACTTMNITEAYEPYKRELYLSSTPPLLPNDQLIVGITGVDFGVTTYRWYMNNGLADTGTSTLFTGDEDWSKDGRICGMNTVRVEADLECGLSVVIGEITFEQLCDSWFKVYSIYPNPASSRLYITPDENKTKSLTANEKLSRKEYEATIYDIKGKIQLKGKSKDYRLEFDTSKLVNATYYLHLSMEGSKEIIKRQIIIQH